jgi:predicted nucleic acid-binding protein
VSRIYWDSMLFIYWLENHPQFAKRVDAIYSRMQERRDELITSAFTIGEVLAGVYRVKAERQVEGLRQLLGKVVSEVIPFTNETADHYARIRGTLAFSPADSIHLACAAQARADLFMTNDDQLAGKFVPGIDFIASLKTELL